MQRSTAKAQAAKITISCPHCGKSQLESAYAKSTYCRHCSRHFDLGRQPEPSGPRSEGAVSGFLKKLSKLVSGETTRQIHCFSCKATQVVSSSAKSSLCPGCGAYIDLRDFKITGSFSRVIQTQGDVLVTSRGELASTSVVCRNAFLEGKVQGNLHCAGKTQVKLKGRVLAAVETGSLVVAKGSEAEFVRPIKCEKAEIKGKVSARIICDSVAISKSGFLEGTVYAKAITVEKGGRFHGELIIGNKTASQQELIPSEKPSVGGAETKPLEQGPQTLALGF